MKNFEVYAFVKDNEILTDTHLFLFEHRLSAVFSLYLFSLTFACKDIKLYKIADFNIHSGILPLDRQYICDYHSGIDLAKELLLDPIYKDSPITIEYLINLKADVDTAIKNKYIGEENGKISETCEKKSEESNNNLG